MQVSPEGKCPPTTTIARDAPAIIYVGTPTATLAPPLLRPTIKNLGIKAFVNCSLLE
jgi:hypothetical protein